MNIIDVLVDAPANEDNRTTPAAKRLLEGEGANIIAFTFMPGQRLLEHKAAHPITVQCLTGDLDFTVDGETVRLAPGIVVHLPAQTQHAVTCPAEASGRSVLLLTMLTG